MLKGVARKHSQAATPPITGPRGGPTFSCQKEARPQIWGRRAAPIFGSAQASASASSDAKTSHLPRQTNAAKMRPLRRSPPRATCKKQHAFPLVFRRLKLCTAEAPPAAATFLQPRADLKAAPGKERKDERFRTARNSATNTSPSPPFPPPVFNVANGNARKAS